MASAPLNIAARLRENAARWPDKRALYYPSTGAGADAGYAHLTFRELEARSDALARGFQKQGITQGTKTILMVKPGPELFAITYALLKVGAVPVVVDPGMGVSRMLHCYEAVGADAFIGIPVAQVVRALFRRSFSTLKTVITVGPNLGWKGLTLAQVAEPDAAPFPLAATSADDLLIVNFTTGSTGPAKGVEYTHRNVDAMLQRIASQYAHSPDDVALAPLPLFALFHLLLGATAILPPMDPTKPAKVDPEAMIRALERFRASIMFASPAFLHRVATYARANRVSLLGLRCVVAGGAPVTAPIVSAFRALLAPRAELHTTYGATEALPIASIESAEILGETSLETRRGRGTCVGKPLPELEVRIVRITDTPMPVWSNDLLVPAGEVGEIAIRGPIVSPRYHRSPEANALMKIADRDGTWHRTGDLGWIDASGRIWFCGRKSQRVRSARGPLFTVQWEGVINAHPDVYRSALVGVGPAGNEEPVMCVELRARAGRTARARIEGELRALAEGNPITRGVKAFLFHPAFPVDIRHNAKIGREALAVWAAAALDAPRSRAKTALRVVPVAGWLFVIYGLMAPIEHPLLRAAWLIDLFLSVVVHGAQLALSLPRGRLAGYATWRTVLYTFLFGATWWRTLPAPAAAHGPHVS